MAAEKMCTESQRRSDVTLNLQRIINGSCRGLQRVPDQTLPPLSPTTPNSQLMCSTWIRTPHAQQGCCSTYSVVMGWSLLPIKAMQISVH